MRSTRVSISVLTLLAGGIACSTPADPHPRPEPTGAVRTPIIGGTLDTTRQGVVAILSASTQCTATIIKVSGGVGWALSAAHCMTPTPTQLVIGNDYNTGQVHAITESHANPQYNMQTHDYGIVKFSNAGPSTPVYPVLTPALDTMAVGSPVVFVGYGITVAPPGNNNSLRWQVNGILNQLDALTLSYNQVNGGGPCEGDSGGPAFFSIGGVEYLAGATSYGDQMCASYGVSMRVSSEIAWIESYTGPLDGGAGTGAGGSTGAGGGGVGAGGSGTGALCASKATWACDPVSPTALCGAAGSACDIDQTMKPACFTPPNDAALGAACDNKNGPFCVQGATCAGGTCQKYCCANSDCSGGNVCQPYPASGTDLGLCAPGSGTGAGGSSPGVGGSGAGAAGGSGPGASGGAGPAVGAGGSGAGPGPGGTGAGAKGGNGAGATGPGGSGPGGSGAGAKGGATSAGPGGTGNGAGSPGTGAMGTGATGAGATGKGSSGATGAGATGAGATTSGAGGSSVPATGAGGDNAVAYGNTPASGSSGGCSVSRDGRGSPFAALAVGVALLAGARRRRARAARLDSGVARRRWRQRLGFPMLCPAAGASAASLETRLLNSSSAKNAVIRVRAAASSGAISGPSPSGASSTRVASRSFSSTRACAPRNASRALSGVIASSAANRRSPVPWALTSLLAVFAPIPSTPIKLSALSPTIADHVGIWRGATP
jgi:hypothetical protein